MVFYVPRMFGELPVTWYLTNCLKELSFATSFGGTTIDLRHTHIAPGETYIDLDCSWGGVEIYVPSDWKVVFKCNAFFGGCDDKRWQNGNINKESVLVILGNTFLSEAWRLKASV